MGGFPNAPLSSLTPDPSITSVPLQLLLLLPGVTVTQALITRLPLACLMICGFLRYT